MSTQTQIATTIHSAPTTRVVMPGKYTPRKVLGYALVYALMILIGWFLSILTVLGYLAIAVFILVPFSALRHRTKQET